MKTLEEVIGDMVHESFKRQPPDYNFPKATAEAIRQWIKERLPKEKKPIREFDDVTAQANDIAFGYNQALKDVRQAIGEK